MMVEPNPALRAQSAPPDGGRAGARLAHRRRRRLRPAVRGRHLRHRRRVAGLLLPGPARGGAGRAWPACCVRAAAFLFHEHVRGTGLRRVLQEVATPVQVRVADGCHPNRDFLGALWRSPFTVTEVEHLRMPGGAATVVPMVVGRAQTIPAATPTSR
ncbi:hypothetical protein [Nocardioides convexus]|uniref:hypothetical protein n=1 Tax=Nocardioides convexus TaxID=2712224 RepID=UPI0024187275|nr:hypothetical protein [Nocardioides convexus]